MNPPIYNLEIQNSFFFAHPHENQAQMIGWHGSDSIFMITGKSFSEALILASTNPHYDKRLFMELP